MTAIASTRVSTSAGLLLALIVGASAISATRAAPSPLPAALTALAVSSAYQVTYTAGSTETPPATEKRTLVLVRQGSTVQIHALDAMRPSGAGEITIVEDVASGSTVCERVAFNAPLPLTARYACGEQPARAAALAVYAEPIYGLVGDQAAVSFTRASGRTIGGQHCAGYTFQAHAGRSHSAGTLYVSPSGFPCQQDATTFGSAIGPSNGQRMATVKSVTVWSHANDPRLAMPSGVLPTSVSIGTFAVLPAAARVGQVVTLSGRTRGGEVFVPPFVQMASLKLHTVTRSTLAQCGGTAPEPVAFGQVLPTGRQWAKGAPAHMAWHISFHIPVHLTTYVNTGGGSEKQIPTPTGVYRLVAGFGPAFFCPSALPTAHDEFALAAQLTVLP